MSAPSENAQSVMNYLGCPCEHFPKGTNPSVIMSAYNKAFAEREMGGFTPMIFVIGSIMHFEKGDSSAKLRNEVLAAPPIDPREWFGKILTEHKTNMGEFWDELVGEIARGEALNGFSGIVEYGTGKSSECVLAKIPVTNPWEVFAWFPFGGWNECPMPEEMFWIGKYWYEKYGAVPAVMSHDILEFAASPVRDKTAALDLALEHFAFCFDRVAQGSDTIGRLADSLAKSSVWYFWWD